MSNSGKPGAAATDQTFNLFVGREMQAAGRDPQTVMVMPLLEGIDGTAKMSKTAGNAIGITEDPAEMFGKVMSIPDSLMPRYYELAAGLPPEAVQAVLSALRQGELHPASAKRRLARRIVELYHSPEDAQAAERRFDVQFRERGIPDDVLEVQLTDLGSEQSWSLPELLVRLNLSESKSDARRLIMGRAIRLDGQILTDPNAILPSEALTGRLIQRGKRRFVKLA
jgi:tyrosyl-tRNA synthetase